LHLVGFIIRNYPHNFLTLTNVSGEAEIVSKALFRNAMKTEAHFFPLNMVLPKNNVK
jgi:hypothetical protein